MAVGRSTAAEAVRTEPQGPIRTCIGCRRRVAAAELFRVVVAQDSTGTIVPDLRVRAPGRGAWLHRDPQCLALAQRRRAFGRALRVAAAIEISAVSEYVSQSHSAGAS